MTGPDTTNGADRDDVSGGATMRRKRIRRTATVNETAEIHSISRNLAYEGVRRVRKHGRL